MLSYINPYTRLNYPTSMYNQVYKVGSKGDFVKIIQKDLTHLGYSTKGIDGKFGANTEDAVKRFQRDHHLKADGVVGKDTLRALNNEIILPQNKTPRNNNNSADKVTISGNLSEGDRGESVEQLQKSLKELGYYKSTIDSKFGDKTEDAVERFQRDHHLTVDGVVGKKTKEAISDALQNKRNVHNNKVTISGNLSEGDRGKDVEQLQKSLKELGYYKSTIDGRFGDKTEDAVERFQKDHHLTVDGVVGKKTKEAISNALHLKSENHNKNTKYIIIDENNNIEHSGRIILSSEARVAGFASRHPKAAAEIGKPDPGKGKTDITNNSIRFSTNDLGLQENGQREGSQVNAFRHTLWQASITKKLGTDIASEIGYAHEDNPRLIDGIDDFSKVRFKTLELADEAVDLLNNKIGRSIGNKVNSKDMDDIARATLNYYHDNGLWVAKKQSDGYYAIVKEKLSDAQYKTACNRLKELDSDGFTKEQRKKFVK